MSWLVQSCWMMNSDYHDCMYGTVSHSQHDSTVVATSRCSCQLGWGSHLKPWYLSHVLVVIPIPIHPRPHPFPSSSVPVLIRPHPHCPVGCLLVLALLVLLLIMVVMVAIVIRVTLCM